MKTEQLRNIFLEFFRGKGHTIIPSDSLAPQNDPTLLFTGAGMNQFKEYFLGIKKDLNRAASCQKCLRTADLDEVGKTAYHHSFFEMLGNFSFGDYFKREAIVWAWEFLTGVLKIPKKRLRVSVHKDDHESYKIWRDEIGVQADWIYRLGDQSNFWPSDAPKNGPNGPCGPCSEIYYDQTPGEPFSDSIEDSHGRFAEIWNLVFTQFDRQDGGDLVPLAQKNIDTGMGLERLACVLQGQKTNYEIDIFQPINRKIEELLKLEKAPTDTGRRVTRMADEALGSVASDKNRFYSIADHIRAVVFSISDGIIPSNEGRGYVIRKLIRRALWHAHNIKRGKLEEPFLYLLVPSVTSVMKKAYPELAQAEASIATTIKGEEERFLNTLETGLNLLEERIANLKKKKTKSLPADFVFELHDTYGLYDEITRNIASAEGLEIKQNEVNRLMDEQRKRAKDASKISGSIFVTTDLEKKLPSLPPTEFLGYQSLEAEGKIVHLELEGTKGIVILDRSPFYAESGGQVGDQGTLKSSNFEAHVTDTQKKDKHALHFIEIVKGAPKVGDKVKTSVEQNRRERAMRNHTATHLLHAALRNILGPQVRQLGSLVAPDRLRFDFSYSQSLTAEQIGQIEDKVNEQILQDIPVSKEEKPLDAAKKEGAIAFFGEKYGQKVRVISVADFSKELCGGTHCDRTGQIGSFVIVSESSIGSGARRIEALTGEGAMLYVRNLKKQVQDLSRALKTTPDKLVERIGKLQESVKRLEKLQGTASPSAKPAGPSQFEKWLEMSDGFKLYVNAYEELSVDILRRRSDELRAKTLKTVYFLASENQDKIYFVLGVSHDLVKMNIDLRDLGKSLAALLRGNSGGRKDFIQGGAPNQGQFRERWEQMVQESADFMRQKVANSCKF